MASLSRLDQPCEALRDVERDALSIQIFGTQDVLGWRMPFIRRLAIPVKRLLGIFGNAHPVCQHQAEIVLRTRLPQLGQTPGLAISL